MTEITESLPSIDASALRRALIEAGSAETDATLDSVEAAPIGIGAMADTFLLSLSWTEPSAGPGSVVAKLPSADPTAARTAASLGAYEREVQFYRELAPRADVSVPRYHGTLAHLGVPGALLLEDLSRLTPGDQFADVPATILRRLREQLARLQAPFWDDPELASADWLHRRLGVPIPGIVERMSRSWTEVGPQLTADFDPDERAQIERFVRGAGHWAQAMDGPFSLTHHDYRVDNMLFDPADPDHAVILDWQTVGWGVPMFDVAYLMATSVGPDERRRVERDEIARHVDDLAARGIDWSFEEAWTAYRRSAFATLLMLVPPIGSVKSSDRSNAMFRRLLRHGARMALDLDADEFLPIRN